jgi:indolepyruvate ferredoxin oxidoreductase
LITGVGGTGVTTIAALLGMAAHIEGRGVTVLDQTGLAQKNGAVTSHVRFARSVDELHTVRLAAGEAGALLACDMVVATSAENLATLSSQTPAVVNADVLPTAAFQTDPDADVGAAARRQVIEQRAGAVSYVRALRLASELLGDSIYANVLMMGYAWQSGLVPVSREALERAIELNGAAAEANLRAFAWGRLAADDPAGVEALLSTSSDEARATTLDEIVARRAEFLARYQDAAYAERYRSFVEQVRAAEAAHTPGRTDFAEAVARYYFKLLAYKDEYEVARLYTDGEFAAKLADQFEGDYTLRYHFAPQWRRGDKVTGRVPKSTFGPWMRPLLALIARGKRLRGTRLDPFGYLPERRMERRLVAEYEETIIHLLTHLGSNTHSLAVEIAALPEFIRGFGIIKRTSVERVAASRRRLLERFAEACRQPHLDGRGSRRPTSRRVETHGQRPGAGRRGAKTNFPLPSRRAVD